MRYGILISFLFLFAACQKEGPEHPSLEVHAPGEGFAVSLGDTLRVELEARSGNGLSSLRLGLVGAEEGEQRVAGKDFDLEGKRSVHKEFLYPIEGKAGGTGAEQALRVIVLDEKGERDVEYVGGRVEGEPLRFLKAFIVLRPAPQRTVVEQFIGEDQGVREFRSFSMDHSGSASNSRHGEFLIAGSEHGDLLALDGMTGDERWRVPNRGSSPQPYFLGLISDREGEWALVPLGTERLEGYRGGSGPALTVDALEGHLIREAALVDGRLLTEQEPNGSDPRQWVSYYASTGAIGSQRQIPDRDIVRILEGGPGEAYVLANENGQGRFLRYDVRDRVFGTIASLPSGRLWDGLRMSDGRTLLLHDRGLLVHDRGKDLLRTLHADRAQEIAYDRVRDRVFVASGKRLKVLDAEGGAIRWEGSFQDSIEGLHVLTGR